MPDPTPPRQRVATVDATYEQIVVRARRAIAAADLWIIHEIDTQMLLERAGHRHAGIRQILYFHPRFMIRLLAGDPTAFPEVPLRLAVRELGPRCVEVRSPDPAVTLAGHPALAELADELSRLSAGVLAAAAA